MRRADLVTAVAAAAAMVAAERELGHKLHGRPIAQAWQTNTSKCMLARLLAVYLTLARHRTPSERQ